MTKKSDGNWYYQQIELGLNYRMTELQAALGISQIKKVDEFVRGRHMLKVNYDKLLSDLPIVVPYQNSDSYSALHLYPIQIKLDQVSTNRRQVFNEMRDNGIGVNVHYIPIHTQPFYANLGFKEGDFPNSEYYYSRALSLPLFPSMTPDLQKKVCETLKRALQ